jgi:hypothetical protein
MGRKAKEGKLEDAVGKEEPSKLRGEMKSGWLSRRETVWAHLARNKQQHLHDFGFPFLVYTWMEWSVATSRRHHRGDVFPRNILRRRFTSPLL